MSPTSQPYIKWNGHTHTPFCRHGSSAPLTAYLDHAIAAGFERYSVTEHPPLPSDWLTDPGVQAQYAMEDGQLDRYFDDMWAAKAAYADRLDIRVGLELDYLPGSEPFTEDIVRTYGHRIEDVVFSVHYLPGVGGMRCVDLSADDTRRGLIEYYGSMDAVVRTYYDHVRNAILYAATLPSPKRLGHVNLIQKFRTELPPIDEHLIDHQLKTLLPLLKSCGVGIDVNTAGLRKSSCSIPYVPEWFIETCMADGIECVFGSDAHHPEDVAAGWSWFAAAVLRA